MYPKLGAQKFWKQGENLKLEGNTDVHSTRSKLMEGKAQRI